MIERYFQGIDQLLASNSVIHSTTLTFDKRSTYVGFIRGEIYFLDGSRLHLREFVNVERDVNRYSYAYHYQSSDGSLVFRYDNSAHFPNLPTFPAHKHVGSEDRVVPSKAVDIADVLAEIEDFLKRLPPDERIR